MQTTAAVAAPWWAGAARADALPPFEAFANRCSVKAGETVDFHFRDPAGSFTSAQRVPFTITRLGWPDREVYATTVPVYNRAVPADASANGCLAWGVGWRMPVPAGTRSGLYWATLGEGERACSVPVVVRPAARSPGVAVLLQVPVTTAQAYNNYGGQSLYEYNSRGGVRGAQVSFNRPFVDPGNFAFDPWQPPLIRWLEKNGIPFDCCTSLDLHADPHLLDGYQLFLTAGHDEYWSREMRQRLDAFVAGGGHAAIFSGNSCWWQVRFDDVGGPNRRMVCWKSRDGDPGGTAATKTTNWWDLATPWPENATIGLSFQAGASWTSSAPRPVTPFLVHQSGHWAFAGTGLGAGAGFGAEVVGYETDAAAFRTGADRRAYPTGADGTPPTLQILAQADASGWDAAAQALGLSGERSGYSAIAVFSRGGGHGTVFNAGTTDWVFGLQGELDGQPRSAIGQITWNVLRQLSRPWQEPAQVRQWHGSASGAPWMGYWTLGTEVPAGMALDGVAFRAFAGPVAGSVPVYRYRSINAGEGGYRHALGLSPVPKAATGFTSVGIAFHAFATARAGAVPVYQWRNRAAEGPPVLRYSTSAALSSGWTLDGPLFHVPA